MIPLRDDSSHFLIKVILHSDDARKMLSHPEVVRESIAEWIEKKFAYECPLFEECDFTLEVSRYYSPEES